jgi:thiamine pyrophosphokinase
MRALLAIGGEGPERAILEPLLSSFDFVCAADSGLDLLSRWGLEPNLIVGDMDSVSSPELLASYPRAEVIRFPRDKDESDTELGLRLLFERGYFDVSIAGGGGGRIDHLFAIKALFERPERRPRAWFTEAAAIRLVEEGGRLELPSAAGEVVSVFPLASGASGMESGGLKWPLAGLVWSAGGFGLSNEALSDGFWVRAGRGDLLVVTPSLPIPGPACRPPPRRSPSSPSRG